jgi:hypothetical protein
MRAKDVMGKKKKVLMKWVCFKSHTQIYIPSEEKANHLSSLRRQLGGQTTLKWNTHPIYFFFDKIRSFSYLSENLPCHFGSPEKKHLSLTTSTSFPSISGNY